MRLNRKQLPPCLALKRTIDIVELQNYCRNNGYTDWETYSDVAATTDGPYRNFVKTHDVCKTNFFVDRDQQNSGQERYRQLYLTEINPTLKKTNDEKLVSGDLNNFTRFKRSKPGSSNYVPESDEYNYGIPNQHFSGVFHEILSNFRSPLTRVRLAVLLPGASIAPHVDYDPVYITRYHIPIFTNSGVFFGYSRKNVDGKYQMPADGHIYFFNSGLKHWVNNEGHEPRLHLIIDTNGQLDLQELN